jgi:hypothetical protein
MVNIWNWYRKENILQPHYKDRPVNALCCENHRTRMCVCVCVKSGELGTLKIVVHIVTTVLLGLLSGVTVASNELSVHKIVR